MASGQDAPITFAVAMELLAARIRQHHTSRGLGFTDRGLIISMYANDITLYIRKLEENLHPVLREVVQFGGMPGVNISWSKSTLFPI